MSPASPHQGGASKTQILVAVVGALAPLILAGIALHTYLSSGKTAVAASPSASSPIDPERAYLLGLDYRNGTGGVIASDSKAAQQFILAAELGHAKAQGELGSLYAVGAGVPLDRTEAVRWYRLGAAQGDGAALWGLGLAYQNGSGGLEKNDFEAVRWFQKSADVGYIQGQRSLAEAYEAGIGGLQRDDLQALYWFRKAAAQDSQASTYAIAMMYRDGRGGLARNNDQYVMWLRKAASLDHPDAKADLRRLGLSQ